MIYSLYKKKKVFLPSNIIYQIILDVERYPEFLPWCRAAKIISKKKNHFIADLEIRFKSNLFTYRSEVVSCILENYSDSIKTLYEIKITSSSEEFEHLNSTWYIKDFVEYSIVEFLIDFAFKSMTFNAMFKIVKPFIQNRILHSFLARANAVFSNIE